MIDENSKLLNGTEDYYKKNKKNMNQSDIDAYEQNISKLKRDLNLYQEAKKGKAKVDSHYVGNAEGLNHLFEYEYDYAEFLSNISYIIKEGKKRKEDGIWRKWPTGLEKIEKKTAEYVFQAMYKAEWGI